MLAGSAIAALVVQFVAASAATYGTVRCIRLQRFGSDRRLMVLAWFFGLFAAAVFFQAAWQLQIADASPPENPFPRGPRDNSTFNPTGNMTFRQPFDRGPFRPEGTENTNILLVMHHVLMLASLSVGVWAFGHRPKKDGDAKVAAPAITALAFIGSLVPAMLAMEAGLSLYLAARSFVNHVERRSAGAIQVALGFLLFFIGHLLFFVVHEPGMPRSSIGDVLSMVGIFLLIQVLPRP